MNLLTIARRAKVISIVVGALLILSLAIPALAQQTGTPATTPAPAQPSAVSEEQKKGNNDHIKNQLNYHKDLTRQVSDLKREVKGLVTTTADQLLNNYLACLQKLQPLVGTEGFGDSASTCDAISKSIEEELTNNLYLQRDCHYAKTSITNRNKERKDLDRQLKDILRNDKNANVAPLQKILSDIDTTIAKSGLLLPALCTRDTTDKLQDFNKDLESLFQDFNSASSDVGQKVSDTRRMSDSKTDFEKNIKRGCEKDKLRERQNYEKEYANLKKKGIATVEASNALGKVLSLYTTMCVTDLASMKAALDKGDLDGFDDARQKFSETEKDFWDTLSESRQGWQENLQRVETSKYVNRDLKEKGKEIRRFKKQLEGKKKLYTRAAKKYAARGDLQANLTAFSALVKKSEELITKIESSIATAQQTAAADPDLYWADKQEELNDLVSDFNEVQNTVEAVVNVMQNLKQIENEVKRFRRELKDLAAGASPNEKALITELEGIIKRADMGLKEVLTLAITDPEDALATLNELFDLSNEWNETLQDWEDKHSGGG